MNKLIKISLPFIVSFAGIVILWELIRLLLVNLFGNQDMFFPSTLEILKAFSKLFTKKEAWIPILNTFLKSFIALFFVTVISIPFALFISKNKRLYNLIRPAWDFFRSIPPAMLFPLFIVIVGFGDTTKVIIAIYFSFLILALNLSDSFISIFNKESNIWKHMNFTSQDIFIHQIFPQLLDSFFSNLRIIGSIIIALIVIAEMYIGQETGIGKALSNSRNDYNWANFYSYIIITGIVGMFLNYFIDRLHKTYTTK